MGCRRTDSSIECVSRDAVGASVSVFLRDVGGGLLEVSHNSLAAARAGGRGGGAVRVRAGRRATASRLRCWAGSRRATGAFGPVDLEVRQLAEAEAVSRATAANPSELTRQQSAVVALARPPLSRCARTGQPSGPEACPSARESAWTRR